MKKIVVLIFFWAVALHVNAQSTDWTPTNKSGNIIITGSPQPSSFDIDISRNDPMSGLKVYNASWSGRTLLLFGQSDGGKYGYLAHHGQTHDAGVGYTLTYKPSSTVLTGGDANGLGIVSVQDIRFNAGGYDGKQRMIINSAGLVGIGTATPGSLLHIAGESLPTLKIESTLNSNGILNLKGGGTGSLDYKLFSTGSGSVHGAGKFIITNSSIEDNVAIGIDAVGKVGIGTSNPLAKFQIDINSASTNYSTYDWPQIGLFLKNVNSTANNFNLITFGDANGYSVSNIGSITTNHTTHAGKLFFATRPSGGALPLERMMIDENGNIGIGTTNPITKLQVDINSASTNTSAYTTSEIGLLLRNTNATNNNFNMLSFGDANAYGVADIGAIVTDHTNHKGKLFFSTRPNAGSYPLQRMVIDENGNIGVGTTTPGYALEIAVNQPSTNFGNSNSYGLALTNTSGIANSLVGIQFKSTVGYTSFSSGIYSEFVDPANNYAKLHLVTRGPSSVNQRLTIDENGHIGIGTTSPQLLSGASDKIVEIAGTNNPGLALRNTTTGGKQFLLYSHLSGGQGSFRIYDASGSADRFVLNSAGDIGIGTSNPDQKLTVNGTIHGTRVKVDLTVPGPDYVFEKDYNLPSLEEIKNYIDQNKHLPEVPSAKEMEKNGIDVGEINMLLLKKVEELTLHLIQQAELNRVQSEEMQELKKLVKSQK